MLLPPPKAPVSKMRRGGAGQGPRVSHNTNARFAAEFEWNVRYAPSFRTYGQCSGEDEGGHTSRVIVSDAAITAPTTPRQFASQIAELNFLAAGDRWASKRAAIERA